MDKLFIEGPVKLKGEVNISCAKNAYLPILAAILLTNKPIKLKNLPKLRDIDTMLKLLTNLGVIISKNGNVTTFDASGVTNVEATYDLVKTMRASIFVLGPLLTRFKRARVSLPGGCAIGARPIDIHLVNLEKMGATIELTGGYVEANCKTLVGTHLVLSFPSVGATENLMMAGVFAEGKTIIENAALEPEIDDLANFLNAMGAKISGIGTRSIIIEGVKELGSCEYQAIGDRIEAATYLMAGLITNSSIKINQINPAHLGFVIERLTEMGAKIEVGSDYIKTAPAKLKCSVIDTAPYPGFPTDAQAQMLALTIFCEGTSVITEHIFENRFMHVPELIRMGARIDLKGNSAIVHGDEAGLTAAPVMCTDLRASAALVIAALATKGTTEIQRVYHLDRGYEKLDEKLAGLGVKLKRINDGN
jgi:UDP-N-acetylglucosamine 1-carboxyvinyltransferase